ncbi:MAG: hypothetical protein Q9173_003258 [Seirophora scorigena]
MANLALHATSEASTNKYGFNHYFKEDEHDKFSYAITDSTVPIDDNDHKSIWLYPLFFTGDDTKNDLPGIEDGDKLKA